MKLNFIVDVVGFRDVTFVIYVNVCPGKISRKPKSSKTLLVAKVTRSILQIPTTMAARSSPLWTYLNVAYQVTLLVSVQKPDKPLIRLSNFKVLKHNFTLPLEV